MLELMSWAAKRGALKRPKVEIPAGSYKMLGCWYTRTSVVVLCFIASQVATKRNKGWNLAIPCMRDHIWVFIDPESCQHWVSMAIVFQKLWGGWHAAIRNVAEAQRCPSHDTRQDGTVSQILCSELCHPDTVTTSWQSGDHLAARPKKVTSNKNAQKESYRSLKHVHRFSMYPVSLY